MGVCMTENSTNSPINDQETSNNSENIQDNSDNSIEIIEKDSESSTSNLEDSSSEDELALPEPDIILEESVKKKKELPEWMKKKLERERLKETEIKAEAERLKQENELLKLGKSLPQNIQSLDPYMPQRDQFENDGEYFIAISDYRDAKRAMEGMHRRTQEERTRLDREYQEKLNDAVENGRGKYKDFDDVTDYVLHGEGFPSNRAMGEAIFDSEYKDDILYFLGKNLKEAERIADLNPVKAAKEIAKLEVRFESKKKSNITKAPSLLQPTEGGRGSAVYKNPESMSMEEFRQWYQSSFSS